ncbi:MAG: hypothetical protein ACXWQO_14270, partial [Bdellovibrionota bacterium]
PSAPDCSAKRNELAQSEQRLSTAHQILAQTQGTLQSKTSERDATSGQIEQEVYAQRDEIVRREAEARRNVADLESRRDQMDTHVRDLNQYVIPGLQNELASLQSRRTASTSELNSARGAVASSTAAYRRYNASVNFDALNANVNTTAARVAAIKQEIASLNAAVKDRQQIVSTQTAQRDSLDKQIVIANETVKQKTARQGEVSQLLVPYSADRKVADGNIDAAKLVLADVSHELAAQLPQSAGH